MKQNRNNANEKKKIIINILLLKKINSILLLQIYNENY